MMTQQLNRGDRVRVTAPGEFYDHTGVISRITQHSHRSRAYYWIVFDGHPWQHPGIDWSFVHQELRRLTLRDKQQASARRI